MTKKMKQPTATTLVLEALIRADDFRTSRQLQAELQLDTNHVSAALCHLAKHKAVEFVEADSSLWWFATPETDTRSRVVDERAPEDRPRKPRRLRRLRVN